MCNGLGLDRLTGLPHSSLFAFSEKDEAALDRFSFSERKLNIVCRFFYDTSTGSSGQHRTVSGQLRGLRECLEVTEGTVGLFVSVRVT
jgi:hypothetical protein